MKIAVIGSVATMIACTIAANLLLKLGSSAPPAARVVLGIFSWMTLAGFGLFVISGIVYAFVLRWLPLNVAQALAAAQFVGAILAAALVLSEPVSGLRWLGIAFIAAGILIVGLTARSDLNSFADQSDSPELAASARRLPE